MGDVELSAPAALPSPSQQNIISQPSAVMMNVPDPYYDPNNDVNLWISFRNLSLSYNLPVSEGEPMNPLVESLYGVKNAFQYHILRDKSVRAPFFRVENAAGYLEPGKTTLLIAPPGAGRSSLLKLISQQLTSTAGKVLFNGLTPEEAKSLHNCEVKKMLRFVDQTDNHFGELTVRETLEFAHSISSPHPSEEFIDNLIDAFDMKECANTFAASCSGGQRRRLSVMVGACNPSSKLLALDQLNDGLDSYITERVIFFFKKWAQINNTHVICALQQPSPTVFDSFDNIVMMKEGHIIFNGPRSDVEIYLNGLGFPVPDDVDVPSHILNVITHPKVLIQEQRIALQLLAQEDPASPLSPTAISNRRTKLLRPAKAQTCFGVPLLKSPQPCQNLQDMLEYYHSSPYYIHITHTLDAIDALRAQTGRLSPLPKNTENPAKEDKHARDHPINQTYKSIPSHYPKELLPLTSPKTSLFYGPGYATSTSSLFAAVMARQIKLQTRNKMLAVYRLIPALILAGIFGGLYFQIPKDDYISTLASLIDILTELAYNNLLELGLLIMNRQVLHSQLDLYPTWTYTVAVQITSIPFALVECFVLTLIPYLMVGYSSDIASIFSYYFLLLIHGLVLTAIFRFGASITANIGMAYAVVSPLIAILSISAGFYIKLSNFPYYMWWVHYISPFAMGLKSMAVNQFLSSRYDHLIPHPDDPNVLVRAGNLYLELNELPTGQGWVFWPVLYCIGMVVILVFGSAYFLYAPNMEYTIGTRRFKAQNDDEYLEFDCDIEHLDEQNLDDFEVHEQHQQTQARYDAAHAQGHPPNNAIMAGLELQVSPIILQPSLTSRNQSSMHSGTASHFEPSVSRSKFAAGNNQLQTLTNDLPFTPVSLSFHNITFTVDANDEMTGKPYKRKLLQSITGYASPGNALALMGNSGAGKSTLLNCLYGINKTSNTSRLDGDLYINGQKMTPEEFAPITAYVEQFDSLYPYSTVYETLLFSARMKLPNTSPEILHRVVTEVLDVLELTSVKDLLIGSPQNPILSPSQRKRVSIGIALSGNPSVLFLDEPTTGLSSTEALNVVNTISRISRSSRCVIVTIHQPSAELFYYFDSLLLLGSGGYTMYHGRLGRRAKTMIRYLQSIDGVHKLPPNINPSEWLIEEVSQPLQSERLEKIASENYKVYYSGPNPTSSPPRCFTDPSANIEGVITPFTSLSAKQKMVQYLHINYLNSSTYYKLRQFFMVLNPTVNIPGVERKTTKTLAHTSPASKITENTTETHETDGVIVPPASIIETTTPKGQVSLWDQFRYLFARTWTMYTRNPSLFFMRIIPPFVLNCIYTLVYLDIQIKSFNNILTFVSAIAIGPANSTYVWCLTLLPTLNALRQLFYREQMSGYYNPLLWPLTVLICELILIVPMVLPCYITLYFSINASVTPQHWFQAWASYGMISIFWAIVALSLSLVSPSQSVSEVIQNMYTSLCFVYFGISIPITKINAGYRVIMRGFPFFYYLRSLLIPQFEDRHEIISVFVNDKTELVSLRDFTAGYFGFEYNQWGWSLLWLTCLSSVFFGIALFSAQFLRWK